MIPGEIVCKSGSIEINANRDVTEIKVANSGDRPIQIGSHYHFFEVNKLLKFNREEGYGRHLNIPSGTSVRFEPGEEKIVSLVPFAGKKEIYGLNGLTNGKTLDGESDEKLKSKLSSDLELAKIKGFIN